MQSQIVSIVGNIGVGKTSVIETLQRRQLSADDIINKLVAVPEPVDKWRQIGLLRELYKSFLPDATAEEREFIAYIFQQFAFSSRLSLVKTSVQWPVPPGCAVVVDGHVMIDRNVFAKHLHSTGAIRQQLWDTYNMTFQDWQTLVPEARPRLLIYLRASPAVCVERIQRRGRVEESKISETYITDLHNRLEEFVNTVDADAMNCQVCTIDANQSHEQVVDAILECIRSVFRSESPSLNLSMDN